MFLTSYLPGWSAAVSDAKVDGEKYTATWTIADDRFRKIGVPAVDASVRASLREGKIRSLVIAPDEVSALKLMRGIPEGNKAIVRHYIDQVNTRHYEVFDEIIPPTFAQHSFMPLGPGPEGLKKFYEEFSAAFPDFHFTIEDLIAENDRVAVRLTSRYTHKGTFMEIPATNKAVVVVKMDIFQFQGGMCVEHWDSVDRLGLLQQLGVVPKIPRWSTTQGYESFR